METDAPTEKDSFDREDIADNVIDKTNTSPSDSQHDLYKWVEGLHLRDLDPAEIPHLVKDVQDKLHTSVVRKWRQTITGDPDR